MAEPDQACFWNNRYQGDDYVFGTAPNAFLRREAHKLAEDFARKQKPGGILLMQGYRPKQLAYGTGGPRIAENMYVRRAVEFVITRGSCCLPASMVPANDVDRRAGCVQKPCATGSRGVDVAPHTPAWPGPAVATGSRTADAATLSRLTASSILSRNSPVMDRWVTLANTKSRYAGVAAMLAPGSKHEDRIASNINRDYDYCACPSIARSTP